nr:MFS transporter [Tissierella sp.]
MDLQNKSMEKKQSINFYRWMVWGILVAIYLIVFFHRLSVGVIVDDLNKSFGMTSTQIANLGAMYFYAYTIMQIPAGVLADSLGPKKTVIMGSVVAAIGSIIFALSRNIPMAYFGRLLVGVGVSVVFLCILKIQSNWYPADKFASMSGLTSFIGSLGGLLAQTPLIILVGLIGWRSSFVAMGVITLILAVLAGIFVKNTPMEMGFEPVNPQEKEKETEIDSRSLSSQLLEVVKNPKVWYPAFVFGGVIGGFLLFTGTFGVSYIVSVYGLSKTYAANLISAVLLLAGASNLIIGGISDKLKRRKLPTIILAAITVLAWSLLVFLKPPVFIMAILIFLVGFSSSIGVLCWSVSKEVSDPKLSGMAMSIVNTVGFSFAAILMLISGKIIDINLAKDLSVDAAYTNAFIAVVVSALIALVFSFLVTETKCKNIYTK